MGFRLSYLRLTLAHSKGQGQGHANSDNIFEMLTDMVQITIAII